MKRTVYVFLASLGIMCSVMARINVPTVDDIRGFGQEVAHKEFDHVLERLLMVEEQARAGLYNAIYQALEIQECGGVGQCGLFGKMRVQSKYFVFKTLLDNVSLEDIGVVAQYVYQYGAEQAEEYLLSAIKNVDLGAVINGMRNNLR